MAGGSIQYTGVGRANHGRHIHNPNPLKLTPSSIPPPSVGGLFAMPPGTPGRIKDTDSSMNASNNFWASALTAGSLIVSQFGVAQKVTRFVTLNSASFILYALLDSLDFPSLSFLPSLLNEDLFSSRFSGVALPTPWCVIRLDRELQRRSYMSEGPRSI